jgi:hypothetical protein
MHPHRFRLTLGAQLPAVVLEVPNQFLLLCINRDSRLAGGKRRLDRRIDVIELSIPVRILAAFPDLAVGLAAVIQFAQQIGNDALADVEALVAQRFDEVTLAAADPTQRRAGVAADRRFDQGFQRRGQIGLMRHRAFAAAPGTAHPPADLITGRAKLLDTAIDRAPRQSRRPRGCRRTAQSERQRFVGCEQAPAAFI